MESRSGRRRLRSSSEKQHSLTEDRISALPDDLILLILARLRSIAAAVRTSVLSRRWSGGLWTRLLEIVFRDLPFPSLEVALGRVDSPAVSLLEIRVHDVHRPDTHVRDAGFNSLLRAAARLAPEEFVFRLPLDSLDVTDNGSLVVDLPCFHRSTSIVMDTYFLSLRVPNGVAFPALQTLSLAGRVPDLDPLLSCCARLRTLRLRNVFHGGDLRVSSPWLQELFVVRLFQRKHRIDIAALVLKQLSMSFVSSGANISVLAPMAEKILWDCRYSKAPVVFVFGLWRLDQVTLRTAERQAHLRSLQICAHAVRLFSPLKLLQSFDETKSVNDIYVYHKIAFPGLKCFRGEEHTFAEEIEKHMIAGFSVLELHLTTNGHAFGALVFHLLKMVRICGSIRRLKVILERSTVKEECPFDCFCEPWNWRSQTISLSALEEVEINGFQGYSQEIDFLKLVSQCAPMLKKTTMMLSEETSASKDECAKI